MSPGRFWPRVETISPERGRKPVRAPIRKVFLSGGDAAAIAGGHSYTRRGRSAEASVAMNSRNEVARQAKRFVTRHDRSRTHVKATTARETILEV